MKLLWSLTGGRPPAEPDPGIARRLVPERDLTALAQHQFDFILLTGDTAAWRDWPIDPP